MSYRRNPPQAQETIEAVIARMEARAINNALDQGRPELAFAIALGDHDAFAEAYFSTFHDSSP